jgi:competence protein ComEA
MKKFILLFAALLAYTGLAFGVVNINSASKEQLETLEGVGPVKAQAIIDYRKKNGPFKKVEDIKKVDGIGDATFNAIKKDLVLSGTTTGAGKPAEKKVSEKAKDTAEKTGAAIERGAQKTADTIEKGAKDNHQGREGLGEEGRREDPEKTAEEKKAEEKKK